VAARATARDWLLLACLVGLWGSSFALVKEAVIHVAPLWVTALRLSIAGAVLIAAVYLSGRRLPAEPRIWAWYALLGIVGGLVPYFLISWGTQFIASGLSGIFMAVMPLMVVVLAHFFVPDEKLNRTKAVGFVLGFLGVVFLIGPGRLVGLEAGGITIIGELAVVLGALGYAVNGILSRHMPPSGAMEVAAGSTAIGGIIALAVAVLVAPSSFAPALTLAGAVPVLTLALFPTALAAIIYFALLGSAGPSFQSYCNYLIPVIAVIAGWLFRGEVLAWNAFAGLAFILAGIAISRLRRA